MLNPLLLWFLPLALVPLTLHLLTLYRVRTVELSTYRFLMDSYLQQRRRMKLIEWLVMLLRTAFVLLLVLALARPVVEPFAWMRERGGRDVAVIVDVSPSMMQRSAGTTALERARSVANSLGPLLQEEDRLTIIRAGAQPTVVAHQLGADAELLQTNLNALTADNAAGPMAEALSLAVQRTEPGRRLVYVITDGNRRTWTSVADHPVQEKLRGEQVVLLNVNAPSMAANIALIGEPPPLQQPVVGLPLLLRATLVNTSAVAAETTLTVHLDDQQVTQMSVTLQPGERQTHRVSVTPTKPGLVHGRFRITGDSFAEDDTYAFALNVQPRLKVLLVSETDARTEQPAEVFIRAALQAPLMVDAPQGAPMTDERRMAAAIDLTQSPAAQVTDALLHDVEVVVIANVHLSDALATHLATHLRNGGGVVFMPGPRVNLADYQRLLFAGRSAQQLSIWPLRWGEAEGELSNDATGRRVEIATATHPVMQPFSDVDQPYFAGVRVFRLAPLQAQDGGGARDVLLRLQDGTPLLATMPMGTGRVVLSALPADPSWSNLPLKSEFVPLLLRTVTYARRRPPVDVLPSVRPGEPATIFLTSRLGRVQADVTTPDGHPTVVNLQRTAEGYVGAMDQTQQRGYYDLTVTMPDDPTAGAAIKAGFAVNLDVEAADFQRLSPQELSDLLTGSKLTQIASRADDPTMIQQMTSRRELWRLLIGLTVLAIAIEFALATLSQKARSDTTGLAPVEKPMHSAADRVQAMLNRARKVKLTRKRETVESSP